jgi:hypothetical protein
MNIQVDDLHDDEPDEQDELVEDFVLPKMSLTFN